MAKKIPKATHSGLLEIANVRIPCFVLEDGRRVISGRGLTLALGMKGRGQGAPRIATHPTLKPFINEDLQVAILEPIKFLGKSSRKSNPTSGYEATILNDICESILKARDEGVLKTEQELRYAAACESLIRAFAKVGIVALIDEVTDYQYERDRDALNKLLSIYLTEERLKWAKMFPDEFYRQLFKLRGWQYNPMSVKRPIYVGKLTNEIVYKKLPPGVLEKLRELNPINPATKRRGWKFKTFVDRRSW